jgi:hypothetical protein
MNNPSRNLYFRIPTPNLAMKAATAANGAQILRPTSRQFVPRGWIGS